MFFLVVVINLYKMVKFTGTGINVNYFYAFNYILSFARTPSRNIRKFAVPFDTLVTECLPIFNIRDVYRYR